MDDKVKLDELLQRYKSERDPAEPPYRTWASVLAWAGDRLDDDINDFLVRKGSLTLRKKGIPPEIQLSRQLAARIQSRTGNIMTRRAYRDYVAHQADAPVPADEDAVTEEQDDGREAVIYFDPYSDDPERVVVPASDLTALMSVGLVEIERVRTRRDDIAAGRLSDGALTDSEYWHRYGQSGLEIVLLGWVPGALVAIVAGIIVALVAWNGLLFLPIALGGTILGYLATLGTMFVAEEVDVRWLRLGETASPHGVILLFPGPAVALLIALLVLSLG